MVPSRRGVKDGLQVPPNPACANAVEHQPSRSPFFGQATAVTGTRKVDMGVQLSF